MAKMKLLTDSVLALLVFVIVVQNADSVETRFLLWTLALPRALLLFLSTLAGFVRGLLTAFGLSSSKAQAQRAILNFSASSPASAPIAVHGRRTEGLVSRSAGIGNMADIGNLLLPRGDFRISNG